MAAVILLFVGLAGLGLVAQSPPAPRFEVVSVRPTFSPAQIGQEIGRAMRDGTAPPAPNAIPIGIRTWPGGRFTAHGSLRMLIAWTDDVKEYQIDGGPRWVGEDFFVIDARAGRPATPAEFLEMSNALLAERFGLRGRRTTRPGKTINQVLARSDGKLGSALKATSPECLAQIEELKRAAAVGQAAVPVQPARRATSSPDAPPLCGRTRMSVGAMFGGAATWGVSGNVTDATIAEYLRLQGGELQNDDRFQISD